MNIEKMKEFLSVFPQHTVAFEDLSNLRITISKEKYSDLNLIWMQEIIRDYADIWCLDVVRDSQGRQNNMLKQKLTENNLKESQFDQISEFDFVLDKKCLSLEPTHYYVRDISTLTKITSRNMPDITVLYNHTINFDSVINFINIESDDIPSKINMVQHKEYKYRNLIYVDSEDKHFNQWKNNIAIETLISFITHQTDEIIVLEGHKKVKLKLGSSSDFTLTNREIEILKEINNEFNHNNINSSEKKNLLIKVMTIYLSDDATVVELISKIDKIQETFKQLYNNFINNKLDNFFEKKNKIIDEIINTSSKVNDEINKMFTQIFSVLITLLATQFLYYVRSDSLSEESKTTFDILFLSFLTIYSIIFFFSNRSTIKYYKNFISSYFDIVGSVYELNNDENELRKKLMDPSLNRFVKSFWSIFIFLISFLTLYTTIKFGILGLLLVGGVSIIFIEVVSVLKL